MKLGILGGSFNPVHLGHLFLADTAFSQFKLDRIIFVPAYRSPFKLGNAAEGPGASDRIDMLASAITGDYRYTIDNCEIKREGVSYTINTIEDIISRYLPDGKPVLVIGDDLAHDFLKWRDYEKILELAEIAVVRRISSAAADYPFPHIQMENEVMDISSSKVRQKIREGSDWRSLVPSGVRAIIEDREFYGFCRANYLPKSSQPVSDVSMPDGAEETSYGPGGIQAAVQYVETAAREALNTERFLHSRNTAIAAFDLCRRFGLDPMAGYLAGIAHDLAKQLDGKQILKIVKSKKDEYKISSIEIDKPGLLHGKAAAVLLKEQFRIHNKDVLEAVAFHTFGSEKMGHLAKVIYIADKTECSRNIDPALRKMCMEADLDSILCAVLERTIVKLKAKELSLSKDTLLLLEKIKKR